MIRDRYRIAIVGAGNIGARHLESLARLEHPIDVDVVEPSVESRMRALALLARAGGLANGRVRDMARVEDLLYGPDIAIIATNSRERRGAVKSLLALGAQSFILEKVLFTRLAEYDEVERLFRETKASAWVNCPRRIYPQFGQLRAELAGGSFSYTVDGRGWALGCNAIHHLDEFAALAGRLDVTLYAEELLPGTVPASRTGYVEFFGRLTGKLGDCRFAADCKLGVPAERTITIETNEKTLTISPLKQTLTIHSGGLSRVLPYLSFRQSEATAGCVHEIIHGRGPGLPDYETAAALHRPMIRAFLEHLRLSPDAPLPDECPIT